MIINKWTYGYPQKYEDYIVTTFKNKYFPCYVADLGDIIAYGIYSYKKPSVNNLYCRVHRQYKQFFKELKSVGSLSELIFKYKGEEYSFYFLKGMILDSRGDILLSLVTNTVNYWNEDNKLLTEHLKLFISVDFIQTEYYKNVFKKIQSEYIDWCYDNDIPVVITTSQKIEKELFSKDFELSFETLGELQEHLESGIGENLFFEVPEQGGTPEEEILF